MKKLLIALVTLLPTLAIAAGGQVHLEDANVDLHDKASLERGLGLFQHYCSGCHSTQYQRYERVANDLGISADDMRNKYMFTDAKIGELMQNAIPPKDAAKWFGATPPDLTLVARVRGEDWVYSYLKGFYKDPSRPFGVNNTVFPSVGMPHVLEELQGTPVKQEDGTIVVSGGKLNAEEYDQAVRDITGFLVYSAEPVKLERQALGWWVLGFLFIFFIVAYLLKKEYWKDVH
ncbi:cytochrome c1 [Shewanella oneidensis MR-1]|uniref:Ubiquinol-cytochrome c reductase cytochrome c1 subunit PetC n=1 Tax=Shewanella oneidensis (strain ATCC 700550 / JCM 31522 / CIP 106686 / LMG 19005 / NCIMB 14063 / MR-1) TaxID=211586 RepID=Q8EJ62_SHEON|nr:cytochrome c1 [Shewanella oneidensis]AAN53688.1 ubiquinol-cytochrome c reductase cytochrome c1 subunit PetC [Shewanella oneidensis MR-1]MDX5997463.1 cytochrome c1 [Shewanella oneidensis]MEE2027968.1 Ammonia monooxygenase gamma subunit [Shewanella oneidensis]QKG95503.1 cytochrome c1 [Shewanella oneidensis MR-1]